ncbi:MAG: signal peptidase I [Clostridia bacterium]|nr:signal peptidase I [Clostridia bacterium]
MQDFEPVELPSKTAGSRRAVIAAVSVLMVVILAVASALLVRHFVTTTYIVDGISMYPTLDGGDGPNTEFPTSQADVERMLSNGELLYLNKLAKIKRGDIIVFVAPDDWKLPGEYGNTASLVKRVIAVGGDHLQFKNGNEVYLNGQLLDEPYINGDDNAVYPDFDEVIPDGHIFCMGDNRAHSTDCREHGAIPLDCVIGKCFLIKGINGKLRWCK